MNVILKDCVYFVYILYKDLFLLLLCCITTNTTVIRPLECSWHVAKIHFHYSIIQPLCTYIYLCTISVHCTYFIILYTLGLAHMYRVCRGGVYFGGGVHLYTVHTHCTGLSLAGSQEVCHYSDVLCGGSYT